MEFKLSNSFCLVKIGYMVLKIWPIKVRKFIQKFPKMMHSLFFYM